MVNLIFYTLFFALFVNFSFGSLRYSQINRAFMSSYKGLYESCVVTVSNAGEPIKPFFDKDLVKEEVKAYLAENVGKYTKDYKFLVMFYQSDHKTLCSSNEYARTVKISLRTKINYLFTYYKEQFFTITGREDYE